MNSVFLLQGPSGFGRGDLLFTDYCGCILFCSTVFKSGEFWFLKHITMVQVTEESGQGYL